MLCVGLRDGEDRDLSTMGFTSRQSGCLILLRNLLMHFSSTLSWSGSPEKSFFFFHSAAWRVKKLGCQCSEIPVLGETWGIGTSKVLFNSFGFHHDMPVERPPSLICSDKFLPGWGSSVVLQYREDMEV